MWHCCEWVREALLVQLSVLELLISLIDMCSDRRSMYAGAKLCPTASSYSGVGSHSSVHLLCVCIISHELYGALARAHIMHMLMPGSM